MQPYSSCAIGIYVNITRLTGLPLLIMVFPTSKKATLKTIRKLKHKISSQLNLFTDKKMRIKVQNNFLSSSFVSQRKVFTKGVLKLIVFSCSSQKVHPQKTNLLMITSFLAETVAQRHQIIAVSSTINLKIGISFQVVSLGF